MANYGRDRKRLDELTQLIKDMEVKMLAPELKAMRIWKEIVKKQVEDEIDDRNMFLSFKEGFLN